MRFFQRLMPPLGLALCHRVMARTAHVVHVMDIHPLGQTAGDVAQAIVREQPWTMPDVGRVEPRCDKRLFQRRGDITRLHRRTQLPGDDVA